MLELNKLYCMDCMDGMKEFTDGIVFRYCDYVG